jgi:hypothetical protein
LLRAPVVVAVAAMVVAPAWEQAGLALVAQMVLARAAQV